jgi:glutamyl-tRNA reductase
MTTPQREPQGSARSADRDRETMSAKLDIILIGLNHKTASIEIRECLGFSGDDQDTALEKLSALEAVREVLLVSTCNRVEVLLTSTATETAVEAVIHFLAATNDIPAKDFRDKLYVHIGEEAVRHIFRVAASLDSMVVGEPQILGQIKSAYHQATLKKTSGVILNRLLHKTFFVAKRIRTETGIGDNAVSISYAAIELARKIFGELTGRPVLLIGAGEMAELAVEHLIRQKSGEILVANRTFDRGVELATRFGGRALRFEEIPEVLRAVDIIISSTGSPDYVVRRDQVKKVLRGRRSRPLFFIDIAVPRDIDPTINRLNNTYVYDIDDLKGVIEENIEDRQQAALRGERLVDEAVIRFRQWYESLDVVPTIVALRRQLEDKIRAEAERTRLKLAPKLAPEDAEAFDKMAQALVNKILHEPTTILKRAEGHDNKATLLATTRKLFKLDD